MEIDVDEEYPRIDISAIQMFTISLTIWNGYTSR